MKAIATALTILCSLAANALPLVWRADWPGSKPIETLVHRGTDVELEPQWYINGEQAASTNWTFQTFVQTNNQATGEWFGPLPGAAFSHTNDIGAAFYNVMVRAEMPDGGVNYTAFARLRMLDSPGYTPGLLPLPVSTIDFSSVVALNAPWLLPDATNAVLQAAQDYTDVVATNYLPLTGGSVTGWLRSKNTNDANAIISFLGSDILHRANFNGELSPVYRIKWPINNGTLALVEAVAAATNALGQAINSDLATNYYTAAETDDAIDAIAAYYITANAQGSAFATYAALTNTTTYYSGGVVRIPTRNDYCVVLADETHDGAEWRYIYAVADGAASGQWEAQYPIETNDYTDLTDKPEINGVTLIGDKTAAQLGLASTADATLTPIYADTWRVDASGLPEGWRITSDPYWDADEVWVISLVGDGDSAELIDSTHGEDALSLALSGTVPGVGTVTLTASRGGTTHELVGYVLGSQTDKRLASEAEAEALRQGKLDKSGGTMTGELTALDGFVATLKDEFGASFAKFRIPGGTSEQYMCFCTRVVDEQGVFGVFVKDGSDDAGRFYALPSVGGDFALLSDLPYAMPSSATVLTPTDDAATFAQADRTVNWGTIATSFSTLNLTFPTAVTGKARDFLARVTVAAGVTAPAIALPQGVRVETNGGTMPTIADGETSAAVTTILSFTEQPGGTWVVKAETVKEVAL